MPQKLERKTKDGKKIYELKNARDMKLLELANGRFYSDSYLSRVTSKDHREKLSEDKIKSFFTYLGVPKEVADNPILWPIALRILSNAGNIKISSLTKPDFLKIQFQSNIQSAQLNKNMRELLLYIECEDRNIFNDLTYFKRSIDILKNSFDSCPERISCISLYIFFMRLLAIYSSFISNWKFYSKDITLLDYIDTINRNALIVDAKHKEQRIQEEILVNSDFINMCFDYAFNSKDKNIRLYSSMICYMFIGFNIIPNTKENVSRTSKALKGLLLHPVYLYKVAKEITRKNKKEISKNKKRKKSNKKKKISK